DKVLAERSRRIPTAALNQWLGQATERNPPPPVRGRSVKVRYATQARVDPPEVVLFTSGQLTPSYRRYLERELRRTFGFEGTPLRLVVRVRTRDRTGGGWHPASPGAPSRTASTARSRARPHAEAGSGFAGAVRGDRHGREGAG